MMTPVWDKARHVSPVDIFRGVFQEHASQLTRPEDYVNHSLYFEAKTFLNGLLIVEDKLAMAHGWRDAFRFSTTTSSISRCGCRRGSSSAILRRWCALNENEPGGKAERYYERTRDGKLLLRQDDDSAYSGNGGRA